MTCWTATGWPWVYDRGVMAVDSARWGGAAVLVEEGMRCPTGLN